MSRYFLAVWRVRIFSGSLESEKCYYPKAVYEIMIVLFGKSVHCCAAEADLPVSGLCSCLGP
jgi:hypothetical protein